MKKIVPVYPWPMHPSVAVLVNAIEGVTPVEAVPGGPGPVLAVRKVPPFACDAIVVLSPEKVAQAIDIVTSDGIRLSTVRDWIGETMGGAPVNETLVAVERKVKFK